MYVGIHRCGLNRNWSENVYFHYFKGVNSGVNLYSDDGATFFR